MGSTNYGFLDPSVLDAFEDVKNASDNYIGEFNFGMYSAESMPKSDEISIGIFSNVLGELGCPIRSATSSMELAQVTPSPSHEKLVNHMYGQLARKNLIEISHGAIVRTDVPCPARIGSLTDIETGTMPIADAYMYKIRKIHHIIQLEGSFRFSVAKWSASHSTNDRRHTLQMEEDIGLVVLEHLGDEFDVHVLDVDILVD